MAMTQVLKRMERKDGVTVHGFRATFRTWVADKCLDVPREIAAGRWHIPWAAWRAHTSGAIISTRTAL